MTKSFPKAAAKADDVPMPGAKPDDKKVCVHSYSIAFMGHHNR